MAPPCRCGGTISETTDDGRVVCVTCGIVLEEASVVSEVSFQEGSNGTSSVVGQFVSSSGKSFRGLPGYSKESREITLENGRRRIQQLAAHLKLRPNHAEAGQRLFMLAVQHNFIQGRKTANVVAACLYIICRREKTPHMLIDFSELLQTNVYVLGHTFLQFCRLLKLQLPIIDPSLYIQRFAQRLEFEEKTTLVANTALKIVARMKRDWIQTGRRPSGICGAGLLIAARIHGFKRTQREIVQVVRICDVTLRKRLCEFEATPTSGLTFEEFESIDLEEECDPPAFKRARLEKKIKAKPEEEEDAEGSEEELTAKGKKRKKSKGKGKAKNAETEKGESEDSKLDEAEIEKEFQETLQSFQELGEASTFAPPVSQPILHAVNGDSGRPEKPLADDDFSDIRDEDIGRYLVNNEDEVRMRTEIWTELNKEYIDMMAQKTKEEQEAIAQGKNVPATRRKRKKDTKKDPAESPAEATAEALRKISSKINYSALQGLFSDNVFPTEKVPEPAAAPEPQKEDAEVDDEVSGNAYDPPDSSYYADDAYAGYESPSY